MKHLITVLCLLPTASDLTATADELIDFNRDIRPILSDRCFACHGPDEESRQADLRLDIRQSATEDKDGRQAVFEGDATKSELVRRINSHNADEVMPPPDYGKPLSGTEVELLRNWINQGAAYDVHWSLQPLARPAVPAVEGTLTGNPIDAFIRAQLEKEKVQPMPAAEARTLVRRLAFDLTGLPPHPELVNEFVQSPGGDAYAALVDRFLASPHYGERMAMYWLDLVRYADTLGFHGDQPRSVSPYRDYVINAFNDNKPFDDFTTEQIAGDLLSEATLWQKVASTYNRLNRASGEGGVQPKEYLAKYSADRVRTTGTVWLGSTFGCAECHDHKFDPFTTRDFYSFAAFFADIKEQGIVRSAVHIEQLPVPTEQQAEQLDKLSRDIAAAEERFHADTQELRTAMAEWEEQAALQKDLWTVLSPTTAKSEGGAKLTIQDDQSILAGGTNADRDVYLVNAERPSGSPAAEATSSQPSAEDPSMGEFIALRVELIPDKSLPQQGPGRASNGNLVLHGVEMTVDGLPVQWESATASHSQTSHAAEYVINGHKHGWAILPQVGQSLQLILSGRISKSGADVPTNAPDGKDLSEVSIRLTQNHGNGHNIGRFRLSVSRDPAAAKAEMGTSMEILSIAAIPRDKRTEEQHRALESAFREQTPLLSEVRNHLKQLRQEKTQAEKKLITTLATTATEPRTIRMLPRGNWMDESGDIVEPAVPHFLPQVQRPEADRLSRKDLADWLTSRDNPLVARTFVNRLWMLMFGHGLARTVDDLGSQGAPPTHPKLLDWLAVEFVDSGWDVKHMIRLIVTSDTYRQTSKSTPALLQRDPYNRLYARQSRWRLDAEMIRDSALSVSGLLNPQIGGVSTKPYQPAGYWAQLNFPRRTYQHDKGPNQYRRGLYTHWQRTFLHPSLLAFDAPPREECTAQRPRSNTPLQSLVLLNDPTFTEAARVLATKVTGLASRDFGDRLTWLTTQTLMREPRPAEITILRTLFEADLQTFRQSHADAARLVSVGETPAPENSDLPETAAWTSVARAILNLHEFITRY